MKVQNLTHDFDIKNPNFLLYPHVRSNASIVHHKGNIYYLVYRLFIPISRTKISNVPIPWKVKWQNSEDTTVFCVLRRNADGQFKLVSEQIIHSDDSVNGIVDSRIYKTNDGYNLSFNTWTQNPKGSIRNDLKKACKGNWNCTYVANAPFKVKDASIGSLSFPCLNLDTVMPQSNRCHPGQREEKNWVWWTSSKGHEMISYFVEPHIVFQKSKNDNTCKLIAQSNGGHLAKIKALYPSMNFLLGAPPIKLNRNEFISVGHVKYNYKKTSAINQKSLVDKVLHFNKACDPKKPGSLIYMMFIYTFDSKPPFALKRISNAFIPPDHGKYLLPFPMGIAPKHNHDGFVISYGEADSFVKLLSITSNELSHMLMDINTLKPEKYKFTVL